MLAYPGKVHLEGLGLQKSAALLAAGDIPKSDMEAGKCNVCSMSMSTHTSHLMRRYGIQKHMVFEWKVSVMERVYRIISEFVQEQCSWYSCYYTLLKRHAA